MKNIKYLGWILLFFLLGCVDDDSRYGDIEIDEITIEGIEDYRELEIGGRLVIKPTITTKFGEESNLSYVWYKYNQEQSQADTLSYEKNLDVAIVDVLPGVETSLVLKVIDNNTGVYVMHRSKFITLGKYAGGTLMLCSNDNQYDLSMLKRDGETFYENIYSLANGGEKLGNESKRILLTKTYSSNPLPHKAVVVTCDDHTGGMYLDPDILVRKNYMREKFSFSEDLPDKLVITANYNSQGIEFLIVNGLVYGRSFSYSNDVVNWDPSFMFLAEPFNYSASEYVVQPDEPPFYGRPVFFDDINGRFMVNLSGGYFSYLAGTDDDYSKFDPSNLKNHELVGSGYLNSILHENWALMKNRETGEYVLLTFEFGCDKSSWPYKWTFYSRSKTVISQGEYPAMYAATLFKPGAKGVVSSSYPWIFETSGISDILFYLSGNRLYAFNVNSKSEGVIIDGNQENYILTGVECATISKPTTDNPDATETLLILRVKDQALSGKQGGIAVYKLNNIGGLSAQKLYAKTGFCDEVIATVEKQD